MRTFSFWCVLTLISTPAFAASGYSVLKKIPIPGDGGWDYVSVDSGNRRVYVSHGTQVEVLDADSGKIVGTIPAPTVDLSNKPVQPQVHGAAVAADLGRGFTTNGRAASMTIFDLKTLKILGEVQVADSPDGFLYDPATRRAFSFSRRAKNATAVDGAEGKTAGMVDLGGTPEAGASDGKGHIFVDMQDQDRIVKVNSRTLQVEDSWPVPPCHQPTSMAIDTRNMRLFIGCRGKQFVALNAETGKIITTLPIGGGTDAAAFDPKTRLVFISNGEGTITIIQQESPDKYRVLQTVKTEEGAKTMALDLKTHKLFLSTADRTTPPPPAPGEQAAARVVVPGTFRVLVVGKQ